MDEMIFSPRGVKLPVYKRNYDFRIYLILFLFVLLLTLLGALFFKTNKKQPVLMHSKTIDLLAHKISSPESQFVIPVKDGVWRTVDPGASGGTLSHAMHPVTGTILVCSDMYRSLLRSRDGTRSFQAIAPDGHPTISPIIPHPEKPGVWYAGFGLGNEQGLARSDDDGETWSLLHEEPGATGRNSFGLVIGTSPDTVLWDFGKKGLMISIDAGHTFKDFSRGLSPEIMYGQYESAGGRSPVTAAFHNGKFIIYLACKNGLYRRGLTDGRWERIFELPFDKVISIAYDQNKQWIWAGFENGRIFSGDLATGQWQEATATSPSADILRTHPDKPGWIWCFSHGRAGLFLSKDRGLNWEWLTRKFLVDTQGYKGNVPASFRTRNKFIRDAFFIDPKDSNTLYLGQIHVSHDGGKSWEFGATRYLPEKNAWHGNGLTLLTNYRAWWDKTNPNRVYLGFSDTGLMRSEDRGYSIQTLWKEKYPDLYPLAYWKKQALETSGSCMAFAVDPEYPGTLYYGMSCKGDSAKTCGMLFKSNQDGYFWDPLITKEYSLPDGIITDLVLLDGNGFNQRKLYALVNRSGGDKPGESGIYFSIDGGETFTRLVGSHDSPVTFPLMNLDYCRDSPDTMYMASSTRGGKRPAKRIRKKYDNTGGIFKTTDSGVNWTRTGGEKLAGAVQVAVHPRNPDIAYAAVVPGKDRDRTAFSGGIFKTIDGGKNWNMVLKGKSRLPEKRKKEKAYPTSIAINPALPDIIYAVIKYAGVMRSVDAGRTWESVDWEHLKKFQGNYHTLAINPHDPAEFYLALFGNSFLAYRDPVADALLKTESRKKNLIRNGGFELTDLTGKPVYWTWNNLRFPGPDDNPVLSIETSPDRPGRSLRIKMKEGRSVETDIPGKAAHPVTWLSNRLSPYDVSLMRGRTVNISYEVRANRAKFEDLPVLSLVETRDGNRKIKAELPANLAYGTTPYKKFKIKPGHPSAQKWFRLESSAQISWDAGTVSMVLFTTLDHGKREYFIDNIELSVK